MSSLHSTLSSLGPDANLVSLLYRSRATIDFSPQLLETLVQGARISNHDQKITGALYFEGGAFMQWLEGPAPTVSRLFGKIGLDRRHTDVHVVSFGRTPHRVFGDWDLRLFHGFTELPSVKAASPAATLAGVIDDPQRLREMAMALTRGRVGELAIAFEQAGPELRLQARLCERLMRQYGELWANDECTELEMVLGLALAQSQFRLHRARFPVHALAKAGETVLVMPVPGERHTLGASLVQASLEEQGYGVPACLPETREEMVQVLQEQFCNHAVVVGSGVFPRAHRVESIRACSDLLRTLLPDNASIGFYGQLAAAAPVAINACGCDFGDHSVMSIPANLAPLHGALH